MEYQSTRRVESRTCAGVSFVIARISFGRRLELTKQVRELGRRIEFEQAGQTVEDKLSAAISGAEIDRLYLESSLLEVHGLEIDSCRADKQTLVESGPEELCREIVREIRQELGLSEEERKN